MNKKLPLLFFSVCMMNPCANLWAQNITTGNITSKSANEKAKVVNVTLTGTLSTTGNSDFRQLRDLCYYMETLNLASANCVSIPKNALHSRHNLRKLTLPNNLQTIGSQAFFACDSLKGTINFPNSTTNIGASSFAQCKMLDGIYFTATSKLNNIGSYAFEGCESIKGEVTIPKNVMILRDGIFANCKKLEGVVLHDNLQSIGANTFSGCESLTGEVALGRMITRIGGSAFAGCKSLTSISMPRALQVLGDAAFMDCSGLKGAITIPGSIVSLGKGAFAGCAGLSKVVLPAELKEVQAATFAGCTGLKKVIVYAADPMKVDATAFAGINCSEVQLLVPEGSEAKYREAEVWKNFNISAVTAVNTAEALAKVEVNVEGNLIWVKNLPQGANVKIYNAGGQLMQATYAQGDVSFAPTTQGVYMVSVNGRSYKVKF